MKRALLAGLCAALAAALPARAADGPPPADICVLVGAVGEDTYVEPFKSAADAWQDAAKKAGAHCTVIGLDPTGNDTATDLDLFRAWVKNLDPASAAPVWIAYIGHGTYDGRDARLNLRGPDISATDMAALLKPLTRQLIFIDGGSASAPFLNALSGRNRVIITATQSGREVNYARFGEKFAHDIASPDADIDQDGETSVLEAFVTAALQVQSFYDEEGRLASEHAVIDDNGDQRGTPASWFNGTRVVRQPQAGGARGGRGAAAGGGGARGGGRGGAANTGVVQPPTAANAVDGAVARYIVLVPAPGQRVLTDAEARQRDQDERQLDQLRARKDQLSADAYYAQLEILLRQMAVFYLPEAAPAAAPASPPAATTPPPSAPAAQ